MTTLAHRSSTPHRHDVVAALVRVIDYLFGLLYTLLVIRLALEMIGARRSGFVALIAHWTEPFYGPFRGILPTEIVEGGYPIVWSIVVALLAYVLLHSAVRGALRLLSRTPPLG